MLQYVTSLLPQCGSILEAKPKPIMSNVQTPYIANNSIIHYSIIDILSHYDDVDSYYHLISSNIKLLFRSEYLLKLVIKKYKLSQRYYQHILLTYLEVGTHSYSLGNTILKLTMDWYPYTRSRYAAKYEETIRRLGYCHVFPEVSVEDVSSIRLLELLGRYKYDEVLYLMDYMDNLDRLDLREVDLYSCSIPILTRLLAEYSSIDNYYIIAYTRIHNKLPDVEFPSVIDLDVAILCIKYNKEIIGNVKNRGSIEEAIDLAFGIDLTPEVEVMCGDFIDLVVSNKYNIHINDDNAVNHYIKVSLFMLEVSSGGFDLDDCNLCQQLRVQLPTL